MKKYISLITNIAPLYRSHLWRKFIANNNYHFNLYFGKEKQSGIKQIDFTSQLWNEYQDRIYQLKNIYVNGILIWQVGVISISLRSKSETVIITGDCWNISNWLIALIYRIKRVNVVFWGHGLYGNETGLKKKIRVLFYKLANSHLLYERRSKELMILSGFKPNKLHVIFNSLDYSKNLDYRYEAVSQNKKEVYSFFLNPNLPVLIFLGRLTKVKKLNLIVSAVEILANQNHDVNLLLVGDGNEKENLMQMIVRAGINDRCYLYGSCYSELKLSKLIANADLCISPGNVGLTGIHSLSYGTPVLTHNNFTNQMPEVGAINEGKNGIFFIEDDLLSMVGQIKLWLFDNKLSRSDIRKNCYKIIDSYYNPNYQTKVVENLLENNPPFL